MCAYTHMHTRIHTITHEQASARARRHTISCTHSCPASDREMSDTSQTGSCRIDSWCSCQDACKKGILRSLSKIKSASNAYEAAESKPVFKAQPTAPRLLRRHPILGATSQRQRLPGVCLGTIWHAEHLLSAHLPKLDRADREIDKQGLNEDVRLDSWLHNLHIRGLTNKLGHGLTKRTQAEAWL